MLNSLLPNLRLLGLVSELSGKDWYALSAKLDAALEGMGLDLSEEAVYLLYSDAPEAILEGLGECAVARAVIGPKRNPGPPYSLQDWTAAPVWRAPLAGEDIEDYLEAAAILRQTVRKAHPQLAAAFMFRIGRSLDPKLGLSLEAIFHE